jgi:GTP cyclohydrolase I
MKTKKSTPSVKSSRVKSVSSFDNSIELTQQNALEKSMHSILTTLGENPDREGLKNTPKRYAKAMQFLTSGYHKNLESIVGDALFEEERSEIVLVRNIELYSLCEHHLLPFTGKAHVAYLPNKKIIGLSKIPRIVDMYARRLQVQERLTSEISETLMKLLKPRGVAVIIESYHYCMMMRGVQKQNSYTVTSSMLGQFRTNSATRAELLSLLKLDSI